MEKQRSWPMNVRLHALSSFPLPTLLLRSRRKSCLPPTRRTGSAMQRQKERILFLDLNHSNPQSISCCSHSSKFPFSFPAKVRHSLTALTNKKLRLGESQANIQSSVADSQLQTTCWPLKKSARKRALSFWRKPIPVSFANDGR